jgi:hypothetical protein
MNELSSGSSVSIVSDYGLDDLNSILGKEKYFPLASVSRPTPRPTQPPVQWTIPGGKERPGRDADNSTPSIDNHSLPKSRMGRGYNLSFSLAPAWIAAGQLYITYDGII